MTGHGIAIVFLGVLIVSLGLLLLIAVTRRFRKEIGIKAEEKEKTQDVGFVINAFHEVTKQLKEKERELERLKAVAELRAETVESYTENILQCVSNGVITFDLEDRVTTMNRAASEMLGIERLDAIGKVCNELFNEDICRAVSDTREKRRQVVRMEAGVETANGRLWIGYNTALLTDKKDVAIGVILSFSDLTEVKRLQEEVELRERLTALGEMSAGIAHELRNPMGVISGYLNLLAKKADGSIRSVIKSIQEEIEGMNRIIGDMLSFARPASLNRARVDVADLLNGCINSVLAARGEDVGIRMELSLEKAEVFVDEVLMKQALCNIIQNAVEAMPDGGRMSIEARAGTDVTITVQDTGMGIKKDKLKKIFLPFFTTKDKGTGLGLALAHKIILSHGGRIDVISEEGKGSTFRVVLPRG